MRHRTRQRTRQRFAGLVFSALAFGISIGPGAQAADDCIARPNSTAPSGSHWYYHLDRIKHRQCWFLAAEGSHARHGAARKPVLAEPVAAEPVVGEAAAAPSTEAPRAAPAAMDMPAAATPAAAAAAFADRPASMPLDFSGRWPGPRRQVVASASGAPPLATVDAGNAAPVASEMQAVPIPSAEARPAVIKLAAPSFSVRPGALLALLAGALAVAAALVHVLFSRAVRRPPSRARKAIWDTPDPWHRPARTAAAAAAPLAPPLAPGPTPVQAPVQGRSVQGRSVQAPSVQAPSLAPSYHDRSDCDRSDHDRGAEIERTLQQLLDNWRSRAA